MDNRSNNQRGYDQRGRDEGRGNQRYSSHERGNGGGGYRGRSRTWADDQRRQQDSDTDPNADTLDKKDEEDKRAYRLLKDDRRAYLQGGDESGAYGRPEERRGYRKKGHERGGYRRGSGRRKAYNKENDGGLAYRGDEAEEEEKIGGKVPERLLDCDYDPEKEDEGKIEKELKVNFDKAFERDENGRSYKKRRKHSRSRESSNDVTDAPAPEAKPDEPETSPSTPAESSSESPASAASPAGQSEQVNTRQERDNTGQAAGGGGDGSFESVDSLIARIRSHFQGDDPSLRAQPPEQFRITNETGNNSSSVAESGQVNQNGSQNGSLS